MQLQDFSIDQLAQLIPTKSVLYRIMIRNFDFFLPEETSKTITEDYLLGVLREEYFSIKLSERQELHLKQDFKVGKLELIEEISKYIKKPLGFGMNRAPDRNWLLDILNTLNPESKLLRGDPSTIFTRKLPKEILEDLPVPLKKAKRKGIFLMKYEEKKAKQLASKKKVLNRKQKRAALLKKVFEEEEQKASKVQNEICELEKTIAGKNAKQTPMPEANSPGGET